MSLHSSTGAALLVIFGQIHHAALQEAFYGPASLLQGLGIEQIAASS